MKKLLIFILMGVMMMGMGCTKKDEVLVEEDVKMENVKLEAVIDEITEMELIVTTQNFEGFDRARVNIEGFAMTFKPEVGQTISLTILPQVGMSYPAFVNPVEIKLIS